MFLLAKTAHFVRKFVGDPPQTPRIMARPKKNLESLRAMQINIRYSVNEYLVVSDNANCLGISVADYVRRRTTGVVLPRKKVSTEDRRLFIELSRVGNNINQLTKKVHSGNHYPIQLQNELIALRKLLNALTLKIIDHDS